MSLQTVAVLYVDPRGPYPSLVVPGVQLECWGLPYRDARRYEGPWPVVAHPPCGPWGKLRHMYRGNEHYCAIRAVTQVRACGGVLEHPAESLLWKHFDFCPSVRMARPGDEPDWSGGYTVEVNQCDWGHVARKRTWIYCVGVDRSALVTPKPREPTHWISGGRGRVGKKAKTTPVPPGIKVASAQQRRRTPPAFAEYLVSLAKAAAESRAA
jgi:hypothetical protein